MIHAHPDDMLAAAMMATAKAERRAAAKRDGMHPGAMPQCARPGATGARPTPAGLRARALFADNPGLTAQEIAARTGVSPSTARNIICAAVGHRKKGPKPGTWSKPRSPAHIEAERLLREGVLPSEVNIRTGVSRSSLYRIRMALAEEQA